LLLPSDLDGQQDDCDAVADPADVHEETDHDFSFLLAAVLVAEDPEQDPDQGMQLLNHRSPPHPP
jgi:hypothetical protein